MSRWGGAGGSGHEGRVIIDPEMGAFGDNGCIDFIKTEWDTQLDKGSLLPGTGDNIKLRNFGPSWPISFHLGSSCLDHLESLESMYWALLKALKLKTNKKK